MNTPFDNLTIKKMLEIAVNNIQTKEKGSLVNTLSFIEESREKFDEFTHFRILLKRCLHPTTQAINPVLLVFTHDNACYALFYLIKFTQAINGLKSEIEKSFEIKPHEINYDALTNKLLDNPSFKPLKTTLMNAHTIEYAKVLYIDQSIFFRQNAAEKINKGISEVLFASKQQKTDSHFSGKLIVFVKPLYYDRLSSQDRDKFKVSLSFFTILFVDVLAKLTVHLSKNPLLSINKIDELLESTKHCLEGLPNPQFEVKEKNKYLSSIQPMLQAQRLPLCSSAPQKYQTVTDKLQILLKYKILINECNHFSSMPMPDEEKLNLYTTKKLLLFASSYSYENFLLFEELMYLLAHETIDDTLTLLDKKNELLYNYIIAWETQLNIKIKNESWISYGLRKTHSTVKEFFNMTPIAGLGIAGSRLGSLLQTYFPTSLLELMGKMTGWIAGGYLLYTQKLFNLFFYVMIYFIVEDQQGCPRGYADMRTARVISSPWYKPSLEVIRIVSLSFLNAVLLWYQDVSNYMTVPLTSAVLIVSINMIARNLLAFLQKKGIIVSQDANYLTRVFSGFVTVYLSNLLSSYTIKMNPNQNKMMELIDNGLQRYNNTSVQISDPAVLDRLKGTTEPCNINTHPIGFNITSETSMHVGVLTCQVPDSFFEKILTMLYPATAQTGAWTTDFSLLVTKPAPAPKTL